MMVARMLVRLIALTCICSFLASRAAAQLLPGRIASTPLGGPSLVVRSTSSGGTADVLLGMDSTGPYRLSWKPVDRFSETVWVDGRLLQRDLDYQVDYASGVITFYEPVSSGSGIRVEYGYDAAKAVRNAASLSMPLALDLLKKDNMDLQFTALYKQNDPNANAPDVSIYGLSGATKTGVGEFSTMLLFSPERDDRQADGSFGERSAFKFGGSAKTETFQLTTSYLHSGERFDGAKDYNLQQGVNLLDAAAAYNPNKALSISTSIKQTDNLIGEKQGETSTTTSHSIVVSPDGAPKLSVVRTEIEKERFGMAVSKSTADRIQMEHKLSPSISAVLTREDVTTGVGAAESRLTTDKVVLNAKPSDKLAIKGQLVQKDSSIDGDETNIGFNIDASPTKTLSMKAALNRVTSEENGDTTAGSFNVVASPSRGLNVELDVTRKDTDLAGEELAHAVRVASALTPDTRLELGLTGKSLDQSGDESYRRMKLLTTALKNTSVHLDWAQRESDMKGSEALSGIRVETTPMESIKFIGGLSQKETAAALELSKEAHLEFRPFTHTKLGGGYRQVETSGTVMSRITEVNAATNPVEFLDISGSFKSRETLGQGDLDSLSVALRMDAGRTFSFIGAYASNPEDKKGIVQRVNSQSVGLKSDFGRLKITGAMTSKEEYLASKQSEVLELGLDYRLSSESLLSTRYSLDERRDVSLLQTSVYALEYRHRVGSKLNLYLVGKMTTYEKDRALLKDQTEYEAEARLGIKF